MADDIEWAIPDDLAHADLEGITDGLDKEPLTYWLGRARRAILSEVSATALVQRIQDQKVDLDAPKDVQIDLVLGKLGNPGGIRTVQETNGPSSGSVTYGGDTPGQITLTDHHRKTLGIISASRRAARTVATWG